MNIDELSKLAVAHVEKEFKNKDSDINEDIMIARLEELTRQKNSQESYILSDFEKKYLNKVRERILVLFEALNTKQNEEDLQKRLEITITFIEFLLASIEERLKN
ncbi:CiaD-like domain-containing protein [Campylobacter sp. MG1]|uniref:CiaD-like domain-containing protein n=1 Tax=Campylobacter sp. MG1 TaxID=2976332 RepID=UPI00226C7DFA|nr:hypothetical protein [Campylobacter sp. MG1]